MKIMMEYTGRYVDGSSSSPSGTPRLISVAFTERSWRLFNIALRDPVVISLNTGEIVTRKNESSLSLYPSFGINLKITKDMVITFDMQEPYETV